MHQEASAALYRIKDKAFEEASRALTAGRRQTEYDLQRLMVEWFREEGLVSDAPPVVAVVVVRDPGPWFEEALRALAAQDYQALSILVIDAGSDYERPLDPQSKPGAHAKHVVMRTDRTDGLVVRRVLFKGALEHGFYTEETDGILLDRVKFFWNADYGHLSFTTDHNVIQNCDAFGAGDAGVYPGASPQTGEFRNEQFYPEELDHGIDTTDDPILLFRPRAYAVSVERRSGAAIPAGLLNRALLGQLKAQLADLGVRAGGDGDWFDLTAIEGYFPGFEAEMAHRLAP